MTFSRGTSAHGKVASEKLIPDAGFRGRPSPAPVFVVAAFAVLTACTVQPTRAPVVSQPAVALAPAAPGFPLDDYRRMASQGDPVFGIDPGASLVAVEVRRAGSLARLGHDHVVASHDVHGFVAPRAGRADLYVPLVPLVVDEPALRKEAGFETEPSPDAIAGTRRNMLERTLEAERFPFATIVVRTRAGAKAETQTPFSVPKAVATEDIDVTLTLHGVTRTFRVPVNIERDGERMHVAGSMKLKQSDFGIAPLSIAGGAIAVEDEVALRFRIEARAVAATAGSALQL
jgi:YceI-like protein